MTLIDDIRDAVQNGKAAVVVEKVQQAIDEGIPADRILNEGLISAMDVVGKQFEEGEIFVPEMLVAARAMDKALAILKPHLTAQGVKPIGRVAVGTVKGDLHDIGKKLVSIMLEGSGFEIVDLGADVPPEKWVEAVRGGAQIVAMSALLTTTMTNMRTAISAISDAGLRDRVKIMVGGAPVSTAFAQQIGADGYAPDAAAAARLARELIGSGASA
jgi:5-methyltetrahydrofolate--homocysteine methyltransferase